MTALQASIGALNDLVDAPRDAGHKPGKPIPAGLVHAGDRPPIVVGAVGRRAPARRPVRRPRRWRSLAVSSWPSATATTSPSRGRPGRGCRSRSASRCCPVFGWLGATGRCRPRSPSSCRRPSWPARPWPSPMPGPTSSAMRRPASTSVAVRLGSRPRLGGRAPRCWRRSSALPSVIAHRSAGAQSARSAVAAIVAIGARSRCRRRPGAGGRQPPGASGPGSSRPIACRAARERPGSPGWIARLTGRRAGSRGSPRQYVRVVAPDHRDRVLEPELGDRQVLRQVRAVRRADRAAELGAARGRRPGPRRPRPGSASR